MAAELIAVGTELLRFGRRDTNGDWLSERLADHGIDVASRSLIIDDVEQMASEIRAASARSSLVVITGGLGPTEDDRTREALARALEVPLEVDAVEEEKLRRRLQEFHLAMTPERASQARRPRGARWVDNPLGSAPGLSMRRGEAWLIALPGVPGEMKRMFESFVVPRLAGLGEAQSFGNLTLRVCGRTESSVDENLSDLHRVEGLEVTVLGGLDGVELHVRATGETPAQTRALLEKAERMVRSRMGPDLLGVGELRLPDEVGRLLVETGRTLATAESCTAGMLGATITRVPGSSRWYRGGLVVYHDELKRDLAGVSASSLEAHGAVSEPVARELARGARDRCRVDIGIGITGVAGPGGGSDAKPVGLVHLALQDDRGSLHWTVRLPGEREAVRQRAVAFALDRLRRRLMERE